MSIAAEIARRDFSKKVIICLSKKGAEIIASQAAPLPEKNDVYFSDVSYTVLIGGQVSVVRTYSQLITMANSSWSAEEYLQDQL